MKTSTVKSSKMDTHLKEAFSIMKPICDMVMLNPSPQHIKAFETLVREMKINVLQELQQYLLFPFITHLQSKKIKSNTYEFQQNLVDGMKEVLQRVKVTSYEMCLKIEMALIDLVFDKSKPGMVADAPEELKLSVMQCITALMLNIDTQLRIKLLQTQVPLLAHAVFISVHLAKLEKLRTLRIAAIDSLNAHIACHKQLTDKEGHIPDPEIEKAVVDMTSTILPGVLAALQDVATCADNPGHAVIVAALSAIQKILCVTMNDKHLSKRKIITAKDFLDMLSSRAKAEADASKGKKPKDIPKLSREWYAMAGEKLQAVVRSVVAALVAHEHPRVRRQLADLCAAVLRECSQTMQPSLAICVEVVMSLSSDPFEQVSAPCSLAVAEQFTGERAHHAIDSLQHNFFLATNNLPRVLNNVDSNRKLAALNSVVGYARVLAAAEVRRSLPALPPDRLRGAVLSLIAAAALQAPSTLLRTHATRDVNAEPPQSTPWCMLRHLEPGECPERLTQLCCALGSLRCAALLMDMLLEEARGRFCEPLYLINWLATGPDSEPELAKRLIVEYMQEDVWYSEVEVQSDEPAAEDTCDVTVYDPRAWTKDSVPGLYEGATEIRYTGVSYSRPRTRRARTSAADAQRSVLRCCLLLEGLGLAAKRLGPDYQPYLLKTLCPMLERVGSKYEMLHLAGLRALHAVARALGHATVADLIGRNADYCTGQVTARLKKSWSVPSALQILSVVMEYSSAAILDYLYGIVDDVLVQSCDKYYQQDLYSYLQVFHIFVSRINQWFPPDDEPVPKDPPHIDILKDVIEYIKNKEEAERLLEIDEFERDTGKSVEEMYREDMKKREEDILDYDDAVTSETLPLPQHVKVVISVIRRCIHFISLTEREEAVLTLQVLGCALPTLRRHEDELLPLVHQTWPALVSRFNGEPPVVRRCLDLLVTLAVLARDFIRERTVKEVLPNLYKYLRTSSKESYLKDAGSYYRVSHAYALQAAILEALPTLITHLQLDEDALQDVMDCASVYLSRKQPKPLQELAVKLFKRCLWYNYGASWQHLRLVCDNGAELAPPAAPLPLDPVTGTPYESADADYDDNIRLIFDINK